MYFRIGRFCLVILLFLTIEISAFGQQKTKSKSLSRRISFSEAKKLLANENEGNLSIQAKRFSRTILNNGQVLELYYPLTATSAARKKTVSVPGYGVLYESEAAFNEATRPRHMLEDLIPDGNGFVADIPQLIARLERRLGVVSGRLDFSRASIRRIDSLVTGFHKSHTTAQTDPRLFQELTAYYGESLRRALGGEWRVREEPVGETYLQAEPNISFVYGGKNKEIKPWSSVINALYDEDKRGVRLSAVYDAELKAAGETSR